jgi:hypothetical protein
MVYPGPDAVVVTADEKKVADERSQSRVAAVQAAIARHTGQWMIQRCCAAGSAG